MCCRTCRSGYRGIRTASVRVSELVTDRCGGCVLWRDVDCHFRLLPNVILDRPCLLKATRLFSSLVPRSTAIEVDVVAYHRVCELLPLNIKYSLELCKSLYLYYSTVTTSLTLSYYYLYIYINIFGYEILTVNSFSVRGPVIPVAVYSLPSERRLRGERFRAAQSRKQVRVPFYGGFSAEFTPSKESWV